MDGTKKYKESMKRAIIQERMKTQFHFKTISIPGSRSRMVLYQGSLEDLDLLLLSLLLSMYLLILFPDKRFSRGLSENLYDLEIGSFTGHMASLLSFLSE